MTRTTQRAAIAQTFGADLSEVTRYQSTKPGYPIWQYDGRLYHATKTPKIKGDPEYFWQRISSFTGWHVWKAGEWPQIETMK
jgi:hypothetical protein